MSAVSILRQRDRVSILVDGASYTADGVLRAMSQKCFAVPTLNAAVASMGAGGAALLFAHECETAFASFDELVARIEETMPEWFDEHLPRLQACGQSECELEFAGWSEAQQQPLAFAMQVNEPDASDWWSKSNAESGLGFKPFKLVPLSGVTGNPPPERQQMQAAGLSLDYRGEYPDELVPELDLLHLMEIQRRLKSTLRTGTEAHHWVGGLALLTTVSAEGVTQRVIHRWAEDTIGERIHPLPIEWKGWREARLTAGAKSVAAAAGLSRLQREMLERKARKAEKKRIAG